MGQFIDIQPLLFPQVGICMEQQMYFRCESFQTVGNPDINTLCLKQLERVAFNTYFNSFPLAKWIKYTALDNLWLKLCLKGKFQVSLMGYRYRNAAVIPVVLSSEKVFGSGEYIMVPVPPNDCTICSFTLQALEDGSTFYGGAYCCNEEVVQRAVGIALNICTYYREQYVKDTLSHLIPLLDCPTFPLYKHLQIFITDNGQSLCLDGLEREYIHLNCQDGYGSAGGFARGQLAILSSMKRDKLTHMIFMDDDILLDPAVLVRTFWFLCCLQESYAGAILGGGLLKRNFPMMQVEAGAQWLNGRILSTKPNLDLRRLEHVLFNELEEAVNYQGWWYCCVPLSPKIELPLPIYFHRDDVEFGLRYTQFVYLNGIAVWHDEFENKPYSQNEYYDMRNKLIVNAIHCRYYEKNSAKKDVIKAVLKKILTYRYKEANLILSGVKDYCAGINQVLMMDGPAHHAILKRQGYQEVLLSEMDVHADLSAYECSYVAHAGKGRLYKAIRAVIGWIMPAAGVATVPMFQPTIGNFFRKKFVYNYNSASGGGYLTQKSYIESFRIIKELLTVLIRIDQVYDTVSAEWRKQYPQIITTEYWEKKLRNKEE